MTIDPDISSLIFRSSLFDRSVILVTAPVLLPSSPSLFVTAIIFFQRYAIGYPIGYIPVEETISMTHLMCPICGKMTVLARFDPESLDDDVYAIETRGLGKGKGFQFYGKRSILFGSNTMEKMAERLLTLTGLFISKGLITESELESKLGLTTVKKLDTLRSPLNDEENAEAAAEEDRNRVLRRIIEDINEALETDTPEDEYLVVREDSEDEDEENSLLRELRDATTKLIDDYRAFSALGEERDATSSYKSPRRGQSVSD